MPSHIVTSTLAYTYLHLPYLASLVCLGDTEMGSVPLAPTREEGLALRRLKLAPNDKTRALLDK